MHHPHSSPQSPSEVRARLRLFGLDLTLATPLGYHVHWAGRVDIGWTEATPQEALRAGYAMYLASLQHPFGYPPELWS
jgi:hypothetical protein